MIVTSEKKIYPVYEAGDDIPIGEKFVMDYDRSSVLRVHPITDDVSKLEGGISFYCNQCHFIGICTSNPDYRRYIPQCDDTDREDRTNVWFEHVKTLQK